VSCSFFVFEVRTSVPGIWVLCVRLGVLLEAKFALRAVLTIKPETSF